MKLINTTWLVCLTLLIFACNETVIQPIDDSAKKKSTTTTTTETIVGKNLSTLVDKPSKLVISAGLSMPKRTAATLDDSTEVNNIINAIDLNQDLSPVVARCLFSYQVGLLGQNGQDMGKIGICQTHDPSGDLPCVYLSPNPKNQTEKRLGISVADGKALYDLLENKLAKVN